MKKIIPILIVGALVLSGIGAIALEADDNTKLKQETFFVSEPIFSSSSNYVMVNLEQETSVVKRGENLVQLPDKTNELKSLMKESIKLFNTHQND